MLSDAGNLDNEDINFVVKKTLWQIKGEGEEGEQLMAQLYGSVADCGKESSRSQW